MDLKLHPKQFTVFKSDATEILYGGAAGGGKSHLLRVLAIAFCHAIPGIQVYLFRRLSDDLIKNHIYGPTGFVELLGDWIQEGTVKYVASPQPSIIFSNGSRIHLSHCQHEKDVTKYQGAEIHVLLIDELTHFSDYIYRFLRNRVRLGGLNVPEQWRKKLPLIVCGSNPGSVGHQWVKQTFVDFGPAYEVKRAPREEGGMLRQFIPAKLQDNPVLMANDPDYLARLDGLGNENLVRAMRDGDWDIVAGCAFERLNRDIHMVRQFNIPHWWTRFTSLDWGTAKPFAHGWFAVADEDVILSAKDDWPEKLIPKGSIIMYRELYGWNGKPDEGCREEARKVAKRIFETEEEPVGAKISYRIADSGMWAEHDGPSAAENMMKELYALEIPAPGLEKSRKDRRGNYLEMRSRIANAYDSKPSFYVMPHCQHFWRTVPTLQLDERDMEKGPDTRQEDHMWDCVSYAIASRPMIMDFKTWDETEYRTAREKSFRADRGGAVNQSRY